LQAEVKSKDFQIHQLEIKGTPAGIKPTVSDASNKV